MYEAIKDLFLELLEIETKESPFYCNEHNAENIIQWLVDIADMGLMEPEFGISIPKDFDFSFLLCEEALCNKKEPIFTDIKNHNDHYLEVSYEKDRL